MNFENDPSRWSDPESSEVPDFLRDLMQAGVNEAPSTAKLAALGAKVSATAATSAVGSASVLGGLKVWVAGMGIGAALVGAGFAALVGVGPSAQREPATPTASSETAAMQVEQAPNSARPATAAIPSPATAERAEQPETTTAAPVRSQDTTAALGAAIGGANHEGAAAPPANEATKSAPSAPVQPSQDAVVAAPSAASPATEGGAANATRSASAGATRSNSAGATREEARTAAAEPARKQADAARRTPAPSRVRPSNARGTDGLSETALLLSARRALAVDPRHALELASQHAARFPDSQFAQERDAVRIEALTRSGQLERARREARAFVERYPNSAHAHRFRESLGL